VGGKDDLSNFKICAASSCELLWLAVSVSQIPSLFGDAPYPLVRPVERDYNQGNHRLADSCFSLAEPREAIDDVERTFDQCQHI